MIDKIFMVAALAVSAAQAETVVLKFDSLPSAQGWTYIPFGPGVPVPEEDVFTATGTSLLQNSFAPAERFQTHLYTRPITLAPEADFSLRMVARIEAAEYTPFGFSFGVSTGTGYNYFGLGLAPFQYVLNGIGNPIAGPMGYDPTQFNTFLITRKDGLTSFAVNGETLVQFLAQPAGTDFLLLGDGTRFASARGEVTSFVFRSGAVPEPASWAMLIAGFGLVGAAARRWRVAQL